MRPPRGTSRSLCLAACLLVLSPMPSYAQTTYAQTTRVRGLVTDVHGQPASAATVTLRCGDTPALTITSSDEGTFIFSGAPTLVCLLEATQSGLTAALQLDLTHTQPGQLVHAPDLMLSASPIQRNSPQAALKSALPEPTFEASGIRGLIDPGGYSAPANAAAASSLLSGMADVRRARSSSASAANIQPCAAAPTLLKVVHEHPASANANRDLGAFYLEHGQPALAFPYLMAAHQDAPADAATTLQLAKAQIAQEQFVAARNTLAALQPAQANASAHVLLGQAAEGLGMFAEAAMQYRFAQQQDPSIENIFGEGYELILAARLTDAEDVFRLGLEHRPHSSRLLIGRGTTEYLEGRSAAAVATFLEAVAIDPNDAQAYSFLAQAFLVSGEHADAVRAAMRDHLARSRDDGDAFYLLALVLSRPATAGTPGDDAEVASLLRRAIALKPALALAHFRLGVLLARQDDLQAAAVEFKQTLHLQPTLAEAHFRLSGVERKLGHADAAAREMFIFRSTQPTGDPHDEQDGVDLRQFISVMHRSESNFAIEVCQGELGTPSAN